MKFTYLLLVAAVAAVQDPESNAKAKAASLKAGLDVIAKQQSFEKAHGDAHAKAMAKAHKEATAQRNKVRAARERRITEAN